MKRSRQGSSLSEQSTLGGARGGSLAIALVIIAAAACSSAGSEVISGSSSDASGSGGGSSSSMSTTTGSGAGGVIDPGPSVFAISDVDHHRNRLLDTLAQRRGAPNRCDLWGAMTIVEKGVFLTHTDMLGHRSCMENASVPVEQMNDSKCDASGCTCSGDFPCSCAVGSEMAIDHMFKVWAVNGSDLECCSGTNCCNGGGEWHRTFFSADDKLIAYFRDIHAGLPEWDESNDFAGPHDPFTQSSETQQGTPRGQIHFWSKDAEAGVLSRNGVEGVSDAHIVEIDNDYNILHDSNPEGSYSSTYGRAAYKRHWDWDAKNHRGDGLPTTFLGNGAPADISEIANDAEWLPACGPAINPMGVAPADGGGPEDLRGGMRIKISGSAFSASGNRVYARSRSMTVMIDASSPLFVSESSSAVEAQLPKDIGVGEGFIYIESGGVLSNLQPVMFNP